MLEAEPKLRPRDAATRLGVTEAELVASHCGESVRRLSGPWGALIKELPALGEVMALTRNEQIVHEKIGRYGKISINGPMGLVFNREIDLRIFLRNWHFGYAVSDPVDDGVRRRLRFFDADGSAVHKIFLRPGSDVDAYESLVERYLDAEQSPGLLVTPKAGAVAERADEEVDQAILRERWSALQDVHDFLAMLNDLGVGRVQALRLVGPEFAYRVRREAFVSALESASESGLSIMIFAGSSGVVQIHTGPVKKLKRVGPWFNVLDPGFNLHLLDGEIANAWVVRKPTRDGIVTSLEIYSADDRQIAWMFGERHEGEKEQAAWRAMIEQLGTLPTT